jgi:hypothetical protein
MVYGKIGVRAFQGAGCLDQIHEPTSAGKDECWQ